MTVIYGRRDLIQECRNKPIGEIGIYDFSKETALFRSADVVLFRDRSGRTRVLKNRYSRKMDEIYIEVKDESWIEIR